MPDVPQLFFSIAFFLGRFLVAVGRIDDFPALTIPSSSSIAPFTIMIELSALIVTLSIASSCRRRLCLCNNGSQILQPEQGRIVDIHYMWAANYVYRTQQGGVMQFVGVAAPVSIDSSCNEEGGGWTSLTLFSFSISFLGVITF
jgi:hypothetical protein